MLNSNLPTSSQNHRFKFRAALAKKRSEKLDAVLAPGPEGHLIWGSLLERRRDPLGLYTRSYLEYGDVVRFRMAAFEVFMISKPDHIKYVLQDNHKNYGKGRIYEVLKPVLGRGLLTSEGTFWHRQRRLAQPAFHRERIEGFSRTMVETTDAMLKRWDEIAASGKTVDIAHEMMKLTLQIVSLTLLSTDVSSEADKVGGALTRLIEATNKKMLSLIPFSWNIPTPGARQFNADRESLDKVILGIIKKRREDLKDPSFTPPGDLLTMFMQAKDEDTGEQMDDVQLRDELMTIFLAGHETTANLLAWTAVLLSRHPHVREKLEAEVESVLKGRSPQFQDFPNLKYTKMVLEESMRMYPPAWIIVREAASDDKIGDYFIPKGAIMVVCPAVTHKRVDLWENPEGFQPERFTPENAQTRHKFSYFPFGGGPRVCIGQNFAMMEAVFVLAMITQRHKIELVPGHPIEEEPSITLRPRYGVKATLKKRI